MKHLAIKVAALLLLAVVFAAYLQPEMVLQLGQFLWLCVS